MVEYLENRSEFDKLGRLLKECTDRREQLARREEVLHSVFSESVDPICGSATQPYIRTHTNGRYETLVIIYDLELNRGRVLVTRNQR